MALVHRPPTALDLYKPVLKALGILCDFQPHVAVPRSEVTDLALRYAGIDPEASPWPIHTKDKKGLGRVVMFAFRNQKAEHVVHSRPATTWQKRRGMWGLSEIGADEARKLCGVGSFTPEQVAALLGATKPQRKPEADQPNLTKVWIKAQLPELRHDLVRYISMNMQKSAEMALAEDHVQTFLMVKIGTDAFRDRIEAGDPPSRHDLRLWCLRCGWGDIRRWGSDAATRAIRGARTSKDLVDARKHAPGVPWTERQFSNCAFSPNTALNGEAVVYELEEGSARGSMMDIQGGDMAAETARGLDLDTMVADITSAICRQIPNAGERYARVFFGKYLDDLSVQEIAAQENVSYNRASALLRKAREAVRDEVAAGRLEFTAI